MGPDFLFRASHEPHILSSLPTPRFVFSFVFGFISKFVCELCVYELCVDELCVD